MNTQKLKLAVGIFLFSLLLPNASQAYFTTAQSATKLNADTVLYTVTYKFGFANRELYMPIVAERGFGDDILGFKVGYDLLNKGDAVSTDGEAVSIILSNDEDIQIKNGRYYLPQGKSADFTLVSLVKISPEAEITQTDLSLLVTHLPFLMIKDGTDVPARLNPSELQYYRTPVLKIR